MFLAVEGERLLWSDTAPMGVGRDRVQVYKQESPALGGASADDLPLPTPIEPQQDALEACGLYLQDENNRDETVYLARHGTDLVLHDQLADTTLEQLVSGASIAKASSSFYYAYSTATTTFTTTALTALFPYVVQNQVSGAFSYNSGTGQLTFNEGGVYAIRLNMLFVRTTGASSAACEVRFWCELNSVEVAHTSTQAACDQANMSQMTSMDALLTVTAGQTLRVRCVRTGGSQTITLEPGCRLVVERKT